MGGRPASFAIKAEVTDPNVVRFTFAAQKTMYGGNTLTPGDRIFIFASENEGGSGLFACGIITSRDDVPKTTAARQTPRVSIDVERTGSARRPLGRIALRRFGDWSDGAPETELNFKLYRQATNKIVGLTDRASAFLDSLF